MKAEKQSPFFRRYVFDTETDGLLEEATTIHSLVIKDIDNGEVYSYAKDKAYYNIEKGLERLAKAEIIIGFNSIRFDLPILFKLCPKFSEALDLRKKEGLEIGHLDLLVCSRLIWTDIYQRDVNQGKVPSLLRGRHSLKSWGYRLGMLKGEYAAEDFGEWTQDMQTYCERDVEITFKLWELVSSKGYSKRAMSLEQSFADIINQQEDNGFGFDEVKGGTLYGSLVKDREMLRNKLIADVPARELTMKSLAYWEEKNTGRKFMTVKDAKDNGVKRSELLEGPRKTRQVPFNPTSRQQVSEL